MATRCDHAPLSVGELASQIKTVIVARSTSGREAVSVGWRLLCCILNSAENSAMNGSDCEEDLLIIDCASNHTSHPGHNTKLATLWAIVQTEFLTYRRVAEADNWHSVDFNMEHLLDSFKAAGPLSSPFVDSRVLRKFCRCGRFSQEAWRNERISDCLYPVEYLTPRLSYYISDFFIDTVLLEDNQVHVSSHSTAYGD
jgi:hypothetical protein